MNYLRDASLTLAWLLCAALLAPAALAQQVTDNELAQAPQALLAAR